MSWQRIDETTYIDDNLVTCAEYQLFIDEMREQGGYYQPDHWTSYQFPEGHAREPILGVRHSDAVAFCKWLTERENKEWRYRLPSQEEAGKYPTMALEKNAVGYWVSSEYQFAWPSTGPDQVRRFDVEDIDQLTQRIRGLKFGSGSALNEIWKSQLDKALDLDFAHTSVSNDVHLIERDLQRAHDEVLALLDGFGRGLVFDQDTKFEVGLDRFVEHAMNKERNLSYEFHLALAFSSAFDRTETSKKRQDIFNTYISNFSSHSTSEAGVKLLIDLFTLQERIAGRSPAFEGIRLVKERIK